MRTFALLLSLLALTSSCLPAMILVKIPGVPGTARVAGYDNGDWFVVDSFSFGVERELNESGEKGETEDINIGVGELQECTISKSMDRGSARLAQLAINGNSAGQAEIHFVNFVADPGGPAKQSPTWSTSSTAAL